MISCMRGLSAEYLLRLEAGRAGGMASHGRGDGH
jgi:hypothetical protein